MTKDTASKAQRLGFRFTQAAIDALPLPPDKKRQHYRDTHPKASGLCVTVMPSGSKSFHVRVTVNGNSKRVTLGKHPAVRVDKARSLALAALNKVSEGIDPNAEKRAKRAEGELTSLTVEEAVTLFCDNKQRRISTGEKLPLKESTRYKYKKSIKSLLGKTRYEGPLVNVTEQVLSRCVDSASASSGAGACRSLSSVWNWIDRQQKYRDQLPPNPVKQYSKYHEGLHTSAPKRTRIELEEMPAFFDALDEMKPIAREFFLWMVLTGNRVSEAMGLQWGDLNFQRGIYLLKDTKNRRDAELPIPSTLLPALRKRRQDEGSVFGDGNGWVYQRKEAGKRMGKSWSAHDLRRTFAGIAEATCSYVVTKRLLNHTLVDVTAQYAGEAADLRDEHKRVEAKIYQLANRPLNNVKPLKAIQ